MFHKNHDKHVRSSVLNILLLRVFAIVIVFNVILAIINIQQTITLQKENDQKRTEKIEFEVNYTSNSWLKSIQSVEKILNDILFNVTQKLLSIHTSKDLKDVNLKEQLVKLGLDSEYYDIYIIEDGVVVNTTFPKDLGLNFYAFGEEHRNLIKKIIADGKFVKEKFTIEASTRRLKLYCYCPTKDKKYIVELGTYSEIADEIINSSLDKIKSLVNDYSDIVSINIWLNADNPFEFIPDSMLYDFQQRMAKKSFMQQGDVDSVFKLNGRVLDAAYLYKSSTQSELYKGSVVSIIKDITDVNKPIYVLISKQLVNTSILLVSLLALLLIATKGFKNILNDLLQKTTLIAGGDLGARVKPTGNNEFTTLAEQFNSMVDKLQSSYQELNQKNNQIESKNKVLEQQKEEITAQRDEILNQRDEIEAQQNQLMQQNEQLSKKNSEMMDSILYAKRIQEALFPNEHYIDEVIPDNFILYKPRDVVSGDFYWVRQVNQFIIIVAADCTGHGVPGAFMSMLGISMLNEIVVRREITQANLILNELRKQLKRSLKQTGKEHEAKDGMDMALCVLDTKTNHLQYAGAYNPLFLATQGGIQVFNADRMPIGIQMNEKPTFSIHEIELKPGDTMYIFTDGFVDQLGGPENKKFMMRQLKELLAKICEKSLPEQRYILENTLADWMKGHDQTDDVLMIGFRV